MAGSMSNPRLALALAAALACAPAHAEPTVTVLPLGFAVEQFRGPQSYFARTLPSTPLLAEKLPLDRPLVAVWGKRGGVALHLDKGELKQTRFSPGGEEAPLPEAPRNAVPGTRMQSAGPLSAFLSAPRSDYRHGVFGPTADAGAITITERQPLAGVSTQARAVPTKTATIESGPEAVFEDLEPRLVDLDGDGTPEIVAVKSYLDKGSALAVIGKREDAWKMLAETPPIGERHRWLAPAAIADFDGDGKPEIALVRTPHLAGVLQVWAWRDGTFALKHEAAGFSNHAFGSSALDNAAAVDLDGDGRPELVIPTLDRKALAVLSLRGGIKELRRIALPAPAGRGFAALGAGKDTRIIAALEDGRLVVVRP
jgi:FG-GAP-like repeat